MLQVQGIESEAVVDYREREITPEMRYPRLSRRVKIYESSMIEWNNIYIGTSGWAYPHWQGPFYPAGRKKKDFLAYYVDHFRTVEINNSFYKLPSAETLSRWKETAPSGFIFALKASRYITHMKKLKDPGDTLPRLLEAAKALGDKLGPILFQFPPRWHLNMDRFMDFLDALPTDFRYAFEFRDPDWQVPSVYEALREMGAAFCIFELSGFLTPKEITADFVYIRLHGPDGAYRGEYDTSTLAGWAGAMTHWAGEGREVFCFFDNDEAGYAVQNALRLRKMLNKEV